MTQEQALKLPENETIWVVITNNNLGTFNTKPWYHDMINDVFQVYKRLSGSDIRLFIAEDIDNESSTRRFITIDNCELYRPNKKIKFNISL